MDQRDSTFTVGSMAAKPNTTPRLRPRQRTPFDKPLPQDDARLQQHGNMLMLLKQPNTIAAPLWHVFLNDEAEDDIPGCLVKRRFLKVSEAT